MILNMDPKEFEAFLKQCPDNENGDIVVDQNAYPVFPFDIPTEQQHRFIETGIEYQALVSRREELEEEILDLEADEPLETEYEYYDEYETAYAEWENEVEDLRAELDEIRENIEKGRF